MEDYFVAMPSENPSDAVHGIAFTVSSEDLKKINSNRMPTKNSNNIVHLEQKLGSILKVKCLAK
jgi:hypothetical protein